VPAEKPIRDDAEEIGRPIATADEARKILKIGVAYYNSAEKTLQNLGPTFGQRRVA